MSNDQQGLTVVLRDFAEQFPKEFTVTPNRIRILFWSNRSGKELDFRTKTLIDEFWGEWTDYSSLPKEELAKKIKELLRTDIDLLFLLRLNKEELEILVACIRDRLSNLDRG